MRAVRACVLLAVAVAGCGEAASREPAPRTTGIYVDARPGCDDGRTAAQAASPTRPLCSLGRGLGLAEPDRPVLVRGGTYPALTIADRVSSERVELRAANGERVELGGVEVTAAGSNVTLRGLRITGGVVIGEGAHHVVLTHSEISGPGDAIFLHPGSHHVEIIRNRIRAPRGDGIVFGGQSNLPGAPERGVTPTTPIRDVRIAGNRLDHIGVDAIRPANFSRLIVEDNEISGLVETGDHSDALQTVWGGDGLTFRRNYVHDNTGQGFFIKDGQVRNVVIADNLFLNNRLVGEAPGGSPTAGYPISVYGVVGLRLVGNTVWGNDLGVAIGADVTGARVHGNVFSDMVIDTETAPTLPVIEQDGNVIPAGWNWGAKGPRDRRGPVRFRDPGVGDYRYDGPLEAGAFLPAAVQRQPAA